MSDHDTHLQPDAPAAGAVGLVAPQTAAFDAPIALRSGASLPAFDVITSYSIHYTKLYDN